MVPRYGGTVQLARCVAYRDTPGFAGAGAGAASSASRIGCRPGKAASPSAAMLRFTSHIGLLTLHHRAQCRQGELRSARQGAHSGELRRR